MEFSFYFFTQNMETPAKQGAFEKYALVSKH